MKKIFYSFAVACGLFMGGVILVSAGTNCSTAFKVASGGSGWCNFVSGAVLYGNGTGAIATTTAGTNGFVLSLQSGIPTWVATSSIKGIPGGTSGQLQYNASGAFGGVSTTTVTCAGTASCTGFVAIGPSPITITASGGSGSGNVATSTNEIAGNLSYWTSNSATPALLGQIATTTLTFTGFNRAGTIGSLVGGTNVTITSQLGTSSSATAGQVPYATNTNGTPTLLSFLSTSTPSLGAGLSYSGTLGSFIGGTSGSLTLASSSIFTGTTGQNAYFQGTGNLIGTSSLFTTTASQVLIGTTTAVNTNKTLLQVGGGNGPVGIEINGGNVSTGDGAALIIGSGASAGSNSVLGGFGSISGYFGSALDTNLGIVANSAMKFYTSNTNTTRMTLDTTGFLGLATTTPFTQFAVATGTILVSEFVPAATSTAMTINWQNGTQQNIRVGTAGVTLTFIGYGVGQTLRLVKCNPNGTAGTITWPTSVLWAGGTAPTQTTTANHCDVYSFLDTQGTSTVSKSDFIFGAQSANF